MRAQSKQSKAKQRKLAGSIYLLLSGSLFKKSRLSSYLVGQRQLARLTCYHLALYYLQSELLALCRSSASRRAKVYSITTSIMRAALLLLLSMLNQFHSLNINSSSIFGHKKEQEKNLLFTQIPFLYLFVCFFLFVVPGAKIIIKQESPLDLDSREIFN